MSASARKKPVAIVTGASSDIGLGITSALLERGYCVVANSRAISESKDLKPSTDLVLVDGDIGKRETAVKVVGTAVKHFGRVDLLVNNVVKAYREGTLPFPEGTIIARTQTLSISRNP